MIALSKKLLVYAEAPAIWCPGCRELHRFPTKPDRPDGPTWTYDGNAEAPTFSPSMLITTPVFHDDGEVYPATCCHTFVRGGQIQFLGDCTHELAGQTVALPDIPANLFPV